MYRNSIKTAEAVLFCKYDNIKDYIIYNDGTSSAGQTKHAIDSLNGFISEFADENIDKPGKNVSDKMVMNLTI